MNTTTSRSEGAHRVLKQQLRFFTKDLKVVVDGIEVLLMNQRREYDFKVEIAKMRMPFRYQIFLFRGLIFKVTPHALNLIYQQFFFTQREEHLPNCTHA